MKDLKTTETRTRDYVASLFLSLLRKSRDVGEHEQAKRSLDLLDKRRDEQMRALSRKTDYPSLPELHRPKSEAEIERRKVTEANVSKTTSDLVSASKALMSQLFAWKQPVATLEDDVKSLKARQESMNSKLQGQSLKALEEENTRLREQVEDLAGLVEALTTKVVDLGLKIDSASSTSTNLVSQVEQLTTGSKIQASKIGVIEAKMTDHSTNMAKIETVDLEAINNYMITEKPRELERLNKQEVAIAKLKTEIHAVQSGLNAPAATEQWQQAEVHGAGSNPAPVPAAAVSNHEAPPITTPIVFPGDDFTSLRIEISMLNERILPLEKAPEKLEELQMRQTKAIALNSIDRNKLREEMRTEIRGGLENMAKTFGDLIDKESKGRSADSERLAEVEKTIQRLQAHPASAAANVQNSPTVLSTDVEMAEATLEPFLSPVPEQLNPTGPAEPGRPIEPVSALPQTTTQAPGASPTIEMPQLGDNPEIQVLEKDIQVLQERMQHSENEIRLVRVEFDGQCATLRMMVSTLDSQFNNLTSKDLYHAIIGHLEKMYPNVRQVQEDVKKLAAEVQQVKQNNRTTSETIEKMEQLIGLPVSQKRPLAAGASNGGPVGGEPPSTAMRQKTSGATPGGNASANGSANSSANNSTDGSVNGATVATAPANP
jgi:hypothetical protein